MISHIMPALATCDPLQSVMILVSKSAVMHFTLCSNYRLTSVKLWPMSLSTQLRYQQHCLLSAVVYLSNATQEMQSCIVVMTCDRSANTETLWNSPILSQHALAAFQTWGRQSHAVMSSDVELLQNHRSQYGRLSDAHEQACILFRVHLHSFWQASRLMRCKSILFIGQGFDQSPLQPKSNARKHYYSTYMFSTAYRRVSFDSEIFLLAFHRFRKLALPPDSLSEAEDF